MKKPQKHFQRSAHVLLPFAGARCDASRAAAKVLVRLRERGASSAACPCCPPDALALARLAALARFVALARPVALAARLVALAQHLARRQKAGRRLWPQPALFLNTRRIFRSCHTIIAKKAENSFKNELKTQRPPA